LKLWAQLINRDALISYKNTLGENLPYNKEMCIYVWYCRGRCLETKKPTTRMRTADVLSCMHNSVLAQSLFNCATRLPLVRRNRWLSICEIIHSNSNASSGFLLRKSNRLSLDKNSISTSVDAMA